MTATPHLTAGELIDLAEGGGDARLRRHAESCAACREELEGVVAMLAVAAGDHVVEPSPLFWEHLPRRVSEAIDAGADAPQVPWWRRGRLWMPVSLAAAAALVVAVTVTSRTGMTPRPVTPASVAPSVVVAEVPAADASAEAADPTWDVVTVLSDELDESGVDSETFEGMPGTVDRAIESLSAAEQGELVRLLEEALAKRPS
jgi:hypothetical protein